MKSEVPDRTHKEALPAGYKILWYELKSVLGRGGFGITYLAQDTNLDKVVAIKEYFPSDVGSRESDETVHPMTGEQGELYSWGLERFIKEARILAKFQHANVMRVLSVFEKNNTAYIVMEYEEGKDLAQIYKETSEFTEAQLSDIFIPLLDGLAQVHDAGFIHRDIKPANIYIRSDNSPVLLDFGAARQAVGERTTLLTSLVTAGYAPFEQYNHNGNEQGAWSDIYSLGATLYLGVTNKRPADALARGAQILNNQGDPYEPASVLAADRFSKNFLLAIDYSLMFRAAERPQNLSEWREMLLGNVALPPLVNSDYFADDKTVVMASSNMKGLKHLTERPAPVSASASAGRSSSFRSVRAISMGLVFAAGVGGVAAYLIATEEADKSTVLVSTPPSDAVTSIVTPGEITDEALKETAAPVEQVIANEVDIVHLMSLADEAYSVGRIIRPRDNNALALYREVLSVEPEHKGAGDGIDNILNYYKKNLPKTPGIDDIPSMEKIIADIQFVDSSVPFLAEAEKELRLIKDKSNQVDQLLVTAENFIEQGRDVFPPEKNAFDTYQRVIELDGNNREARNGVREIQRRYEVLFYRYLSMAAFDEVAQVVNVVERISAGTKLEREVNETFSAAGMDIVSATVSKYKDAFESKDKERLNDASETSEWRRNFLTRFFDQYPDYSVDIFDLKYIEEDRKGVAKVQLKDLINKSGEAVVPGAWGMFNIEIALNQKGQWRVHW